MARYLSTTCFSIILGACVTLGSAQASDMVASLSEPGMPGRTITSHRAAPLGGHPLTHLGTLAIVESVATGAIIAPRKRITDPRTSELLKTLIAAKTQRVGKRVEQTLMRHWRTPPNPEAAKLYRAANRVGRMGDHGMAITMFDLLEDKAPDWPEVYAQRAYFKYRLGRYKAALRDIDIALQLQPAHFVALSGKFYTLVALSREDDAREVLELAVTIHPWMSERKILEKMQGESTSL
ncbi:MAG: tetratricopeptide repeat protein [Pseudomonadota bacterium]